jgi:hypothetical protein
MHIGDYMVAIKFDGVSQKFQPSEPAPERRDRHISEFMVPHLQVSIMSTILEAI